MSSPPPNRPLPAALSRASWIFLVFGVLGIAATIAGVLRGHLQIQGEWLGVPIFFELRRYSRGWRVVAFVSLCMGLLSSLVVGSTALMMGSPIQIGWLGLQWPNVSPQSRVMIAVISFALTLWVFAMLLRPEVRAAFGKGPHSSGAKT